MPQNAKNSSDFAEICIEWEADILRHKGERGTA